MTNDNQEMTPERIQAVLKMLQEVDENVPQEVYVKDKTRKAETLSWTQVNKHVEAVRREERAAATARTQHINERLDRLTAGMGDNTQRMLNMERQRQQAVRDLAVLGAALTLHLPDVPEPIQSALECLRDTLANIPQTP